LANSASTGSTGDSRRYHSLRFIADILGGIYIPIMQGGSHTYHTAKSGYSKALRIEHADNKNRLYWMERSG
jgi:hypothetical protein